MSETTVQHPVTPQSEIHPDRVEQRKSRVVWFEIPASDFQRAVQFYQTILQVRLKFENIASNQLGIFPYDPPAISGCVIAGKGYTPGAGSIIYLNADPALDLVLERVSAAGGKALIPRTALPPGMGYFARILDTEGNQVGLHAIS
jgi:predicted enzyme related to lactoylglutathione lyase